MPRSKRWHREDIKAAIRKKGSTLRAISLDAGLCRDAATVALKKPFPSAQRAVSDFLGVPLNTLWPQWYDIEGQRIETKSISKASSKTEPCHRKKSSPELAAVSGSPESPHHPDRSARQARGDGVAVSPAATPTNHGEVRHA